jgi:hypothetical protein
VRAGAEALAQQYGADEVIVVTITHDDGARRRSYELLAEVMELEAGAHARRPRTAHARSGGAAHAPPRTPSIRR